MKLTATDKLLIALRCGGELVCDDHEEVYFDDEVWLPGPPHLPPCRIPSRQLQVSAEVRGLVEWKCPHGWRHYCLLTDAGKARADALLAALTEDSRKWLVEMADKYGLPDLSGGPWA